MMKKTINLFLLSITFLSVFGLSQFNAQDVEGYEKMTEELLSQTINLMTIDSLNMLDMDNVYLLDTREEGEYNVSHIPGSRYVGYNWFKMKTVRDIPKDALVITYCSVGYRSEKMGERLERAGFTNVYNLQGGIFSWANNGGELLNEKNESTTEVHGYDKDWSQWLNKEKCIIELE